MSESDKESLREAFANLRKALPEGITKADADLLQDVALRLMDRGLPRPAVFRYDGQQFGDGELSLTFGVQWGRTSIVASGEGEVSAFSAAAGQPIGPILSLLAPPGNDAERTRFADEVAATWTKVVEVAGEPKGITSRTVELTDEQRAGLTTGGEIPACITEDER